MTDPTPFELARDSYVEVLDATKHQDDKISRFLSAIAFLTGAVLVFADKDIVVVDYQLGAHPIPLVAVALGAFLVLIVTSFATYFLAMSQPLRLPGASGGYSSSHLFFRLIAWETQETWTRSWPTDGPGVSVMRAEYVKEALNIAERADRKYQRSTEASALAVLALFAFVIAVLLSLDVITSGGVANHPLEWTLLRRCLTGGSLALVVFLLLYTTAKSSESLTRSIDAAAGDPAAMASLGRLHLLKVFAVSYPLLVGATVVAGDVWPQVVAMVVMGVASLVSLLILVIRSIWAAFGAMLLAGAAFAAVATESADWQLVAASGLVMGVVAPTLLESRRFRLAREQHHHRQAGWQQVAREVRAAIDDGQ